MLKKIKIICILVFLVLSFENNLTKNVNIKIISPKGIRKAPIKELAKRIAIKTSNGLYK